MAFININITNSQDDAVLKKLCIIEKKIDILIEDADGSEKQKIMDKLNTAIKDIKSTI